MYMYNKIEGLRKLDGMPTQPVVQIDVISDLHLDFYLSNKDISEGVAGFIDILKEEMESMSHEILIVSGDISHYNQMSREMLLQLANTWKYVLVVPGNHDWYMQNKYKDDRYFELIESLEGIENIKFLMDKVDIFEYKGIKIAGTIMFYNLTELKDYAMWKSTMIDSRFLTREFIQDRNDRDVYYYNKVINEVDIFVSHVPIVNLDGRRTTKNLFLNMDVKPKDGVLYLSGHTHYPRNSVDLRLDHDAINVSFGYPGETIDGRKLVTSIFVESN